MDLDRRFVHTYTPLPNLSSGVSPDTTRINIISTGSELFIFTLASETAGPGHWILAGFRPLPVGIKPHEQFTLQYAVTSGYGRSRRDGRLDSVRRVVS